jgi:hypothetical protein
VRGDVVLVRADLDGMLWHANPHLERVKMAFAPKVTTRAEKVSDVELP